ncbi:MCPIP [Mytilus edulis]|uniref:ZC3H12 n=1 Tax=Mytilus edulis TaxID=6550 RepID=A0A8S3VDX9_MYTED|nr:MCPIP [Mytilus edulis]
MASGSRGLFEEFIVDTEQVSQITRAKSKIERMHEVRIKLKEEAKLDASSKRWIRVEGDVRDRMNAREYIIAMCQPCELYELPFNDKSREFLHEDNLEEIEKQTNACIELGDLNKVLIKGTDLAVTLAISSLENIIGQSNIETDGVIDSENDINKGAVAGPPSDWEKRLDSTFLRALSNASDGTCKFDDYHNTSAEVKMAILKTLNNEISDNVDENELFDHSGKQKSAGATSLHPIHIYGDDDLRDVTDSDNIQPEPVDTILEQLTDTVISPRKPSSKSNDTEEVKFLRNFGTSAGYSENIVDEGLLYVDDKTAPCEFLDILKQLKDSKKSENDDDTPMEISDGTPNKSSAFPPPPQVPEGDQGRRSLPKEYKKTLMKHMRAEEDGEMSVDELKKLNEERQKILKTQFESPSKQNSPRGEGSRRKKKNRKKNKKVGQNNNIVSIEKDIRENDEDETRVLEPYQSSSGEDCMIMDVEESSLPVYIQPSSPRAVNNYPQTQRQPIGPQPSPPRQANNYPPTQRQPLGPADNYARNHFPVNPPQRQEPPSGPRENAIFHGRGKIFSCKGIKLCVDYFLKRGHTKVTCFVPAWRRYRPRPQNPISDQDILVELNERGLLEFTPARRLDNKLISSYDDRYVVELAETVEGIIVSNDQYRDLMGEKYSWKKIIEERLLQYNFVGDILMIPDDPLGQHGPKLDLFLSKPSRQPSPLRKRHLSPKGATGHQNMWNQPPLHYNNILLH